MSVDIIHLLPDSVANQIAAGEVIQRPASVVKELVENAIDAGATAITLVVKDAGRTLIQVIDNGSGMSSTDARLAFERHATSKIKSANDLFALRTMGFRGEALASIAAIAQVELRTRRTSDELGTLLLISGSQVERQEMVSAPVGSSFSVKNIFYNVPARRKFLKTASTEWSNIMTEMERIALVNIDVAFEVIHNEVSILQLPTSTFRQRISALFGKAVGTSMLSIEVDSSLVNLTGYIGTPDSARKRNAHQYFFVNNRYMRHPYFHRAVMQHYERLLPTGEVPHYFLHITVDPAVIDVNIHPTKTEVKFENEQPMWQIIAAAVQESLGRNSAVPSIEFDMEGAPDIPIYDPSRPVKSPPTIFPPTYNPFKQERGGGGSPRPQFDWEQLNADFTSQAPESLPLVSEEEPQELISSKLGSIIFDTPDSLFVESAVTTTPPASDCLLLKGRYIATSVKSGLMLIDYHRASIRLHYERYLQQMAQRQGASQRLLYPEKFTLAPSQAPLLASIEEDISALGFDVSALGGHTYSMNAVPVDVMGTDVVQLLEQLIDAAHQKGRSVKAECHEVLALSMARAAAIPYGQYLSQEEMTTLVNTLFATTLPQLTPDGKSIVAILSNDDMDKLMH